MKFISSFRQTLVIIFLLSLSSVSHSFASSSTSSSSSAWDNYRAYLRTSILTGFASREVVLSNLKSAEEAIQDWKVSCPRQDTKRLLRIVAYGEKSLKTQLPYGIDFIASDFSSQLAQAKTLVLRHQCERFTGLNFWSQELRMTKEALK